MGGTCSAAEGARKEHMGPGQQDSAREAVGMAYGVNRCPPSPSAQERKGSGYSAAASRDKFLYMPLPPYPCIQVGRTGPLEQGAGLQ